MGLNDVAEGQVQQRKGFNNSFFQNLEEKVELTKEMEKKQPGVWEES